MAIENELVKFIAEIELDPATSAHPLSRYEEVQKRQTQKEVWTYLQQVCIWLYERRRAPLVEPHGARDYDQCF